MASLPAPPDSTPIAQVYAKLRQIITAINSQRRTGTFTMPTNTSGTSLRVNFATPFDPGVIPVVIPGLVAQSTLNFPVTVHSGSIDSAGFTAYAHRTTGSSSGTTFQYIAVAE